MSLVYPLGIVLLFSSSFEFVQANLSLEVNGAIQEVSQDADRSCISGNLELVDEVERKVTVRAILDEEGYGIDAIAMEDSDNEFAQAAIDIVEQTKFSIPPGSQRTSLVVTIHFTQEDSDCKEPERALPVMSRVPKLLFHQNPIKH